MALVEIQSAKGTAKKAFNGFIYRKEYSKEETFKTTWRCTIRDCNGRLWTFADNREPIERGEHCHLPDKDKVAISAMLSKVRTRSYNETFLMFLI